MSTDPQRLSLLFSAFGLLVFLTTPSHAQMSNRPFTFNAPGNGSVGMSFAGRQAVLNDELFGATLDVLLRSPDGRLLVGPIEGSGRSAIVFSPSGESLPVFRRDFRNGRTGLSAGAFSAFFVPRSTTSSRRPITAAASADTLVNTWTARVLSDTGVNYGLPSAVNVWTGAVYSLDLRTEF